jgi:hypothetical protein
MILFLCFEQQPEHHKRGYHDTREYTQKEEYKACHLFKSHQRVRARVKSLLTMGFETVVSRDRCL